ncbi:MAG: aminotransferase class I/II-fold pyridoxal phosphate-dependent enzyme [Oscillospiraceae bacterium]|nr:aminotransferase class I/II-fold pyridoxal phosphate-dependent enzyme [Oscillospiraceae bacterium]MBR4096817.1 aminotransferase class I/II-fold pyridoxal phosphate-dependent enzyme [Oscillospiraceae bacterium]
MKLTEMSKEQLSAFKAECEKEYEAYKAKGMKLDMSRGKPGADQLDIAMPMFDVFTNSASMIADDGTDCRNYGMLTGIPDAKKLFGELLGVGTDEIIIGGNSSLSLMYDTVARAVTHGVYGSEKPWGKCEKVKFLCPAPGYDRHFAICETFGIEMITVPMKNDGPDMDMVEKLVAEDEAIKGIWCVPLYSNPDGIVYSDETVRRFANLSPKAKDFRIFWDNAYCVHYLKDAPDRILNILDECKKTGKEDMVFIFASTSKISFPGAGVAVMAGSVNNMKQVAGLMGIQCISYDKINQLRHVKYFKDMDGIMAHMAKHKAILAPKFNMVLDMLDKEIGELGILEWNKPNGGYFVSVNTLDGCAKRTVQLCKEAGVVLTGAGATFPYGKDPADKNIRIAPTYPPVSELEQAMNIFCISLKLASAEKLLEA